MKIPIIKGTIDRRILVNLRVELDALRRVLPPPFEPREVNGFGIAGLCLIRLTQIRPRLLPACLGISSENAAHRIAVVWEQGGSLYEGVYITRRDTSSRLNTLIGGKLFPGAHYHARFDVDEHDGQYMIVMNSDDGSTHVAVRAHLSTCLPQQSIFGSVMEASEFFERGSLGYSSTAKRGIFDGLELRTSEWQVSALDVEHFESSLFEDPALFQQGTVQFDCGLLMLGIDHAWHGRKSLRAPATR